MRRLVILAVMATVLASGMVRGLSSSRCIAATRTTQTDLDSLQTAKADLQRRLSDVERRIAETPEAQALRDSLNSEKHLLLVSIRFVERSIGPLLQRVEARRAAQDSLAARTRRGEIDTLRMRIEQETCAWNDLSALPKSVGKLLKGSEVTAIGATVHDLIILYGDSTAFVRRIFVTPRVVPDSIASRWREQDEARLARSAERDRKAAQAEANKRESEATRVEGKRLVQAESQRRATEENHQRLIGEYGTAIAARLEAREVWIGMTSAMAVESRGRPERINRTVYETRVTEQWVYGSTYLYFDNGVLTAWQDQR
jgi:hypothetical protein